MKNMTKTRFSRPPQILGAPKAQLPIPIIRLEHIGGKA